MRAILSFIMMLLCTTAIISAQETTPKVEAFGGYSYASADSSGFLNRRVNLNGWNGSLAWNFNRTFGIVTDFSGHYGSPSIPSGIITITGGPLAVNTKTHTLFLGPQFSFRTARATPFAHVLLGAAHTGETLIIPSRPSTSDTAFATALGGGLDYTLTHRLAWRVQGDYLQTRFFSNTQHNFRLSTGPVFRFGGK
jgi:opacity protein-like surface antigen